MKMWLIRYWKEKVQVKEDGTLGPRNGVSTNSIESKMGIRGSATCVLNFDDAVGYMIGLKIKDWAQCLLWWI